MSLLNELNRRNVLRVGAAYIVTSWLLIQVVETIFPLFGFGDGPARLVVIVLAIGFVPVLIFSWAFEWTPQGIKREGDVDPESALAPQSHKKLDRIIMLVLALALGYFAFDKFVLDPQRDEALSEAAAEAAVEQVREEALLDMMSDKSIAVLPFSNRSEQKADEFFTDGMHDELLTRLSRISALKVISRTSVMRYRDTLMSIPDIAKELSVATILEGGVQRAGNQVRINVQLIDARTDEHLWAEIFDRELTTENLFAIQSEISQTIADSLHATLSPEERERIAALPTDSLEAYNHYLRGRQYFASRNMEQMELAHAEFIRATEIDPEFALAWVGVADSVRLLYHYGARNRTSWEDVQKTAAEKAVTLNDQLGEAYISLGSYFQETGQPEKAKAAYLKGIELNPNYAQGWFWYAISGYENEERLKLLYKAAQIDPMSSIIQINLADALRVDGQPEEGRQVINTLLQRDPGFAGGYGWLGYVDADIGLLANAIRWHRKALKLSPGSGNGLHALGLLYLALGDIESVAWIRDEMDKHLVENSEQEILLDIDILVARSQWLEAADYIENLPESVPGHLKHPWRQTFSYVFAKNYDKAYESLLTWFEEFEDRESVLAAFTGNGEINCTYSGILLEIGEEALGQDLLQVQLASIEKLDAGDLGWDQGRNISGCYLLAGKLDQSIDMLEQTITHNPIFLQFWHRDKDWPWWSRLNNNTRFQSLMARIEGMLAEQRALLAEMNEQGQGQLN